MGARHKLNSLYVYGCLAAAAAVGLVGQSWPLFLIALAVMVAMSIHSGGIRKRAVVAHRPPLPRRGKRRR